MSPAPSSGDPRVDDLRQRLRALGYLDAGVDRFVLGSARRTRSPGFIGLLASLRIGILAAVLLGPAAATGLVTRLPGLIIGPRDAIVAALYLGILFGACVAVVAFLAAMAAWWMTTRTTTAGARFVRRARVAALAAGILVTAACLSYLTLWWRAVNPGSEWSAPVWTVFALTVAVAISLLLGHAVTIMALAVTAARPGLDAVSATVPRSSWKALLAGALACAGASALLLAAAGAKGPRDLPAVPLAVKSSGARAIVLAIDGFDAQLHERMRPGPHSIPFPYAESRSGLFPVLDWARADLELSDSRDPARLWTTIATGVHPETHGVGALETRRVAGLQGRLAAGSSGRVIRTATDLLRLTRPAVASNFERLVKTFWEVAEQAGLRTAVVNWWATWPAAPSSGIVVSDRAVLRLEHGGPLDAELAPPELYERLRASWPEIRAKAQRQLPRFLPEHPGLPVDVQALLARARELDATIMELANAVGTQGNLDLLVVYLPGLDIAQHTLFGSGDAPSPSELNRRLMALQRHYSMLHSMLGSSILNAWREDKLVFVVTQAGRQHSGTGIMAALGPGAHEGARAHGTVLDVAPTILHALGVPASRDLDGRVITALFDEDFLARYPVRYVETYGLRGTIPAARGEAPLDQEMIDRLRSLGYVR